MKKWKQSRIILIDLSAEITLKKKVDNMRLWHVDLIKYLPNSQLVAQWRELNSIYVKGDEHILINYIYDYPREYLRSYSEVVIEEMKRRNIKIRTMDKFNDYFAGVELNKELRYKEHDLLYLKICVYNLYEKYIRGQKDYPDNLAWSLNGFIRIEP